MGFLGVMGMMRRMVGGTLAKSAPGVGGMGDRAAHDWPPGRGGFWWPGGFCGWEERESGGEWASGDDRPPGDPPPCRPALPSLLPCLPDLPFLYAVRGGSSVPQAALFEKILFQPAKLLVDQVVGLVNQADRDVGDDLGRRVSTNSR